MQLNLIEETGELTHVALVGRLDTAGVDAVEPRFLATLRKQRHALVDLSAVEFLSSMGVRMLLSAAKVLARAGGRLVLIAPQPLVAGALRHTAMDSIIPVRADMAEARALLDASPA